MDFENGANYFSKCDSSSPLTIATCVACHRDMGEDYRAPFTFETVDEYQYCGKGRLAAEYLYIFDDGKWSVYGLYNDPDWHELDVIIGKEGEENA